MIALKIVEPFLKDELLINIAGESGTGKTTLALQYIGNMLPEDKLCFWIQAGERFPKNRFLSLFQKGYERGSILNRIMLIPGKSIIKNLDQQKHIIQKITENSGYSPLKIQNIVIDDISHQLRQKILKAQNIETITRYLDSFYSNQLLPLISFSHIYEIQIILIHQSTYSPSRDQVQPFSYKLFSRIKNMVWIWLQNNMNNNLKTCRIYSENISFQKKYILDTHGLIFC